MKLFFSLLFTITCSIVFSQTNWARVEASDGLYSVLLPTNFSIKKDTSYTDLGQTFIFNYISHDKEIDLVYNLMDVHYTENLAENNSDSVYLELINENLNIVIENLGAQLIYNHVDYEEFYSNKARLLVNDKSIRILLYARENRLLLLQVYGDSEKVNSLVVENYFNGFVFIR